ncbi:SAICAR synthetase [Schizopora paradoxa]|uniref:Phosphoribosylaminoimidazole-succinocarboxamide synthase n=1 Tax=Schizopora paradoxa TaxID=27342 RepID=A0A0H2RT96_9AGAM|nr:SAICAR synthetase [Schizopora paradoxa]
MASTDSGLVKTSLPETETLRFLNSGKVRDLYEVQDPSTGASYLLFVATDRISAFDVILNNGVPGKGKLLTQLSVFWFARLAHIVENHLVAATLESMPPGVRAQVEPLWTAHQLEGRTMLVRKARVVKLEAIVRGYLTGSAWSEYKRSGTVHGIPLRTGYVESDKFDEPLFTPSTKADQGEHDENISPERAQTIVGAEVYEHVSRTALALYKEASAYALTRGLILADTKFEFGLLPIEPDAPNSSSSPSPIITLDSKPHKLILIDEALTPDSSRYWSASAYAPGKSQASYDKQYLRDWLLSEGFRKGLESGREGEEGKGWSMTDAVVAGTRERYETAVRVLTTEDDTK